VLLVNLLAVGVAAGLARAEKEKEIARFEQFFTPDLARQLVDDPGMLEARQAEVTVLFADVRGFSRYSERLGHGRAIQWMNDVLDKLSACVHDECGVVVDYVGDELMAMWGAPRPQNDQAARAVRAGLAMLAALPTLNERWLPILGDPIRIGVGINSGPAQVGNIGSRRKLKYGPLGNTVNLASRVQGLTKYLRCNLLVTGATRQQLNEAFAARRVVKARVVNIETPVDLYEVERTDTITMERHNLLGDARLALAALETGHFLEAAQAAARGLKIAPGDGPLLLVLTRATEALNRNGQGFDPVWVPPGK
jgi:adenylate cyclase